MAPVILVLAHALAWQGGAPSRRSTAARVISPVSLAGTSDSATSMIGSVPESSLNEKYDLIVVGGGPAGVAGALKGAYLGKRVLIVDKPKKGTCPERGLDPFFAGPTGLFSKALRDAGKTFEVNGLSGLGLSRDVIFHQVRTSCLGLATNNAITSLQLLERFKVDYLQGEATLGSIFDGDSGDKVVFVRLHANPLKSMTVRSDKVLLCTGSYPRRPKSIPFDDHQCCARTLTRHRLTLDLWSYTVDRAPLKEQRSSSHRGRIFDPDSINAGLTFLPKRVVIAGSGIIAIEYAQIFRKLGADVTIIVRGCAGDAIARIGLDETIAEKLLSGLVKDGVTILEGTEIESFKYLDPTGSGDKFATDTSTLRTLQMQLIGDHTLPIDADLYMACLGRIPRGKGTSLGLEAAGIDFSQRGHIWTDENHQTSREGIFAAGDCTAGPALASTGVDQAQQASERMFGCIDGTVECLLEKKPYPIGMWTTPECAYYGLTKKQAELKGYDAEVGIASYDACLRGRVFAPDGTLKLVFDRETAVRLALSPCARVCGLLCVCRRVQGGPRPESAPRRAVRWPRLPTWQVILGVHIIGTDACELVHYGMDLVSQRVTIFEVIDTLFTAVTFHELFQVAALNGNDKLEFGIQWQGLLAQLGSVMTIGHKYDEKELRACFDELDEAPHVGSNGMPCLKALPQRPCAAHARSHSVRPRGRMGLVRSARTSYASSSRDKAQSSTTTAWSPTSCVSRTTMGPSRATRRVQRIDRTRACTGSIAVTAGMRVAIMIDVAVPLDLQGALQARAH
jgi:NAD(P) transhydrogenase